MNPQSQNTENKAFMPIDKWQQINEFAYDGGASAIKTGFFAFKGDRNDGKVYSNVVGARVLCKAQGLTGAEKKICRTQILAKCGRKPVCSGLFSKKCRNRKSDWLKCAQGVEYTPVLEDAYDDLVDESGLGDGSGAGEGYPAKESGMDMNTKILIGAGLGLLIIGSAAALIIAGKGKKAMPQPNPMQR